MLAPVIKEGVCIGFSKVARCGFGCGWKGMLTSFLRVFPQKNVGDHAAPEARLEEDFEERRMVVMLKSSKCTSGRDKD